MTDGDRHIIRNALLLVRPYIEGIYRKASCEDDARPFERMLYRIASALTALKADEVEK